MYKDCKIKAPFFEIGPKSYLFGDDILDLALAADAAAKANASAIALKASQADLEAVSGRVTTLETWHSNFVECSQEDINGLFA